MFWLGKNWNEMALVLQLKDNYVFRTLMNLILSEKAT